MLNRERTRISSTCCICHFRPFLAQIQVSNHSYYYSIYIVEKNPLIYRLRRTYMVNSYCNSLWVWIPWGTCCSTKASNSSWLATRNSLSSISGKKVSQSTFDLTLVNKICEQRACLIAMVYICAPPITNVRGFFLGSMALNASSILLTSSVDGLPAFSSCLYREL